jgi:hypothetical protein
MAGFGEFLGKTGEAAWQLFVWQIAGQIVSEALGPYLTELGYLVNEKHPDIVLPVNDLVTGVIRGHITEADARADALKLGIDAGRFTHLLEIARPKLSVADLGQLIVRGFMSRDAAVTEAKLTGWDAHRLDLLTKISADAPSPTDLVIALRRQIISEDNVNPDVPSFAGGIREGRLANKWIPMLKELGTEWPSPVEALQAELEGQLTHEQAQREYKRLGGDLQFYQWLFNTRGNAPTPNEALELLNRGIIPERGTGPDSVSYQQAFLEGPWRNKWLEPFLALREYVIPPRSVVAMIRNGTYTDEQASAALAKSGVSVEDRAALIAEGHSRASQSDRDLTQTTILGLYQAQIIDETDTHSLLTALGYSDRNATYVIELANLRREIAAVNNTVARVHTLYVTHKIKREVATSTLHALAVPDDQIPGIMHAWDLEAAVNIKQLSEAQIVAAWKHQVLSTAEADEELRTLGYTAFDAWVLRSNAAGAAQDGKPAQGPNPVGTIP